MSENFIPDNETQLIELVQGALGSDSTISISGQNSKAGFGYLQQTDLNIHMHSFNGISDYDPAELVMRAKSGTPLAEIEDVLSQHGQYLPFEPPQLGTLYQADASSGTIGGTFMANLSGSRRFCAGAARDFILGVRAVSGRGEAYKSGGNVIKNVTGYDMSKLLTGSWGTLSIVTELSFKVLPAPPTSISIALSGIDTDPAMDLISTIAQSPVQVSGLAFIPADTLAGIDYSVFSSECSNLCLIRLEGSLLSVRERASELRKLIPSTGSLIDFENEASTSLWKTIGAADAFMSTENDSCVLKLSIPPAMCKKTITLLSSMQNCRWYVDAAGAWLWVNLHGELTSKNIQTLRSSLAESAASAVLYRAPDNIKREVGVFSEMSSGLMALTQRLKNSFDPAQLLNPKRLFLRP
jgi:glycolate oxidase FAD binding subunit